MRFKRAFLPVSFGAALAFGAGCGLGLGATARIGVGTNTIRASTAPLVKDVIASMDSPLLYRRPGVRNAPARWIFTGGWRLASVRIGDTQSRVKSVWGSRYRVCSNCNPVVWLYATGYSPPRGIAVEFSPNARVIGLAALGS